MPTLEVLAFLLTSAVATVPPNIIIILADDLGWNDVSFHGSNQFLTPNIDALAYSGVILHDYYTQPICTPARAALLTGKHPIHNGMEDDVIYAPQPWGLPLQERLLSQELQERGYVTRAVGKWHLGFFRADYTPTRRGFHSHFGSWLGHQNHYTHMAYDPHPGYDFHDGLKVFWDAHNQFSADLFAEEAERVIANHNVSQPLFLYLAHTAPHAPLQAPQSLVKKFTYIPSPRRQVFAAMVSQLDDCVGRVTEALKRKEMLQNSIIVFITDNGGATNDFNGNVASNWPLRGGKDTLWEGGVRGVGLVWSPLLPAVPRVHHGMVNVQDWLPSLLSAINLTQDISELDGIDQWKALSNQSAAPYQMMLHNIDPIRKIAAIRNGNWKLVIGRTYEGNYDGWYGNLSGSVSYDLQTVRDSKAGRAVQTTTSPLPSDETILALRTHATLSCQQDSQSDETNTLRQTPELQNLESFDKQDECQPQISPCLFNIAEDPCETTNLAQVRSDIVTHMVTMLTAYRLTPPNNKPADPSSYPEHWNNTWVPWRDYTGQHISVTMVDP